MQVNGKAIAAFDPEGLIFAAGINNEQVKLYDLRSFDKVQSVHKRQIWWMELTDCLIGSLHNVQARSWERLRVDRHDIFAMWKVYNDQHKRNRNQVLCCYSTFVWKSTVSALISSFPQQILISWEFLKRIRFHVLLIQKFASLFYLNSWVRGGLLLSLSFSTFMVLTF